MSPRPAPTDDDPPYHVGDGRIFIREFIPQFKSIYFNSGKILIPDSAALGKSFSKKNPDGSEEIVNVDKSVIYGFVVACGKKCKRNEGVTTPETDQGDFPLPKGTIVCLSRAVDHTVLPMVPSYNTWDLHFYILPDMARPDWVPEQALLM